MILRFGGEAVGETLGFIIRFWPKQMTSPHVGSLGSFDLDSDPIPTEVDLRFHRVSRLVETNFEDMCAPTFE